MTLFVVFAIALAVVIVLTVMAVAGRDSEHGTDKDAEDFLDHDDPFGRDD